MKKKFVESSMSSNEDGSEEEDSEEPIRVMKGTTFQSPKKKPAAAGTASAKKLKGSKKALVTLDDKEDEDSDATPLANGDKPLRKRPLGKGLKSRTSAPSPLHDLDPPPPFQGWYSSVWDPELFDQQVPKPGSVIELIVKMSNGVESTEGVVARVDHLEPTDHFGTTAVLKALDTDTTNYLTDWAKEYMKGGESMSGGLIHFCRSAICHAHNDEKGLVHCTCWKLMAPKSPPPGAPAHSGGLPIFDSSTSARMGGVDSARLEASSGTVPKVPRGPAGGLRAAMPFPPQLPPMPPPGREHVPSELPLRKRDAAPPRHTMDAALRERAGREREGKPEAPPVHEERRQSRRRRHKHRDRDRSGSGSDSSDSQVFRGAPTIFKGSKFLQAAQTKEGTLLENGVQLMQKALAARQGGGGISSEWRDQLSVLQGVVTNYLTTGLGPSAASQGKPLGKRNEREMRTLAESLDAILAGDLGRAGDILMQRFRACEINLLDGDWEMAQHLELIPPHQISCVPNGMRQEMQREKRLADKLRHGSGPSRRDG